MTDPTPVGLIGGFISGSSNMLVRKRGSADRMSYNKRRDISQVINYERCFLPDRKTVQITEFQLLIVCLGAELRKRLVNAGKLVAGS